MLGNTPTSRRFLTFSRLFTIHGPVRRLGQFTAIKFLYRPVAKGEADGLIDDGGFSLATGRFGVRMPVTLSTLGKMCPDTTCSWHRDSHIGKPPSLNRGGNVTF